MALLYKNLLDMPFEVALLCPSQQNEQNSTCKIDFKYEDNLTSIEKRSFVCKGNSDTVTQPQNKEAIKPNRNRREKTHVRNLVVHEKRRKTSLKKNSKTDEFRNMVKKIPISNDCTLLGLLTFEKKDSA